MSLKSFTSTSAAVVAAALVVSVARPVSAQDGDASTKVVAPSASVVEKAECVSHLDRAQLLQSARKLREARAHYLSCSAAACPELVRDDCSKSLVELDASMPTVVFSARADGHDVGDARVLLDGEAVASALDGHPVQLEPGNHVARFERTGGGAVEIKLVAREGEKNRAVTATFATDVKEKPAVKQESGRFPVLPVVLGSAGLLSVGGSIWLRVDAGNDADRLRASCAPACDSAARDGLSDKLVVANVALGAGIGLVALAAATWLFDPHR